ncbi:MAG: polysaccharide deacetylase family protein [Defluviitaleaceae bacterium]|nr:polysaccharide deacetylase family protein [Defluviitaleaceae bacterium]
MKKKHDKLLQTALIVGMLIQPALSVHANDISWGIPKKGSGEVQPYPGSDYESIVKDNDAYYIGSPDDNAVYLTFDCGYENGNLPTILDALKAARVPALFFLTGHFMEEEPELVLRMVQEGHLVGNHTYDHPNLTTVSKERFFDELARAEAKFYEITGQEMSKYLRPPEGRFNQEVLNWAKEAGYYTILWSLAYVDWHVDQQKGGAYAHEQVMKRMHPGAIMLLHSTSSDNAAAMADLISSIEEAGYLFKSLQYLMMTDVVEEPMGIVIE